MTEVKHLSHAPIKEALIDLRVKFSADFEPDTLLELVGKMQERLPKIEKRHLLEHQFGVKIDGEPLPSNTEMKGLNSLIFRSNDGLDVAQCRVDGFTFSRLNPYHDWEYLLGNAMEYWNVYCSTAKPQMITRIAVRYINRIQPLTSSDFSDYFSTPLPIPPGCDDPIIGFLTRLQTKNSSNGIVTNIIQACEPNIDNGVSVILDIDVFKQQEWAVDDRSVWNTFELLRDVKNRAFFNSITQKTVRLFGDENDK